MLGLVSVGACARRSDREIDPLHLEAWECAARIAGIDPPGDPPPVEYRATAWRHGGKRVVGGYTYRGIPPLVFDERVMIVFPDPAAFSNLVHEFTHAQDRRAGRGRSEARAEAAEAEAEGRCR